MYERICRVVLFTLKGTDQSTQAVREACGLLKFLKIYSVHEFAFLDNIHYVACHSHNETAHWLCERSLIFDLKLR